MTAAGSLGFAQYGSLYDAAGPGTGFSEANPIFKDFYLPGIIDQLNSKRILMRYIRRNERDIYGNKAVIAMNTGRSEAMNAIDELGTLPDPQGQVYDRAEYRLRYNYGRIKISGPSVSGSASDMGAWLNVLDGEIRGLTRDIMHEFNRIAFGDGSGRLCRVKSVLAGVYTADLPGGFGNNQGKGTQYLRNNMVVAVVDTSAGASPNLIGFEADGGGVVTFWLYNVDYANSTFQLSSTNPRTDGITPSVLAVPPASPSTYWLVKASEGGLTTGPSFKDVSYLKEPYGLAAIVSDANVFPNIAGYHFGGIDASSDVYWRAYQIDNGGIPWAFNQDLLQQMIDGADQWGDGDINLFMTTFGIRRQYTNQLIAQKRYVNTMSLDGGYSAIEFDNRPIVVDKDCTRGRMYGLNQQSLHHFYQTDWHWLDADGSILHRMPDQDAYQATLAKYCNFGTDARNQNALLADIQDF